MTFVNPTLARLRTAKTVTGVALDIARSVDVARMMAYAGFHFMAIRGSFTGMDADLAGQIAITSLDVGIDVFLHIERSEYAVAARLMDNGATGALVQSINDAKSAREAVSRLKYPPIGQRSVGPTPQLGNANPGKAAAAAHMNEQTFLAVIIDTVAGLRNATAIADVSGVDAVVIDNERLSYVRGNLRSAAFRDLEECQARWGPIIGAGSDDAEEYRYHGAQIFLTNSDARLLEDALSKRVEFLRGLGSSADDV